MNPTETRGAWLLFRASLALAFVASLMACAAPKDGDGMRYHTSSGKAPLLDVPPDVAQLSRSGSDARPKSVAASAYASERAQPFVQPTAVRAVGDIKLEGDGTDQWLSIGRSPDALWEPLKSFWQESGFLLSIEDPARGVMETDWAESHANVPGDLVRDAMGKLVDSRHSTGELDIFRTRLERTASGTEIFVTHRGMHENVRDTPGTPAGWQAQPADIALESEYLRKMMLALGSAPTAGTAKVAVPQRIVKGDMKRDATTGRSTLELVEGFDLAWRHVGLALDHAGFTVEDRDRRTGTYFIRFVPPRPPGAEPGLLTKMVEYVKPSPVEKPLKLGIQVRSEGEASTVSVLTEAGAPEQSAVAQRIVQVLASDLR
jgi:outer membrane protein assembly factor BamC